MKKRPFVLFEILIAFTLVTVCILPFLHYPFKHMQKEIDTLFEMELERVAQNELSKMQENFYSNEITQDLNIEKGKVTISLPNGMKRTYSKRIKTSVESIKRNQQEFSGLIKFEITYKNPKDNRKNSLKVDREVIAQKKI